MIDPMSIRFVFDENDVKQMRGKVLDALGGSAFYLSLSDREKALVNEAIWSMPGRELRDVPVFLACAALSKTIELALNGKSRGE